MSKIVHISCDGIDFRHKTDSGLGEALNTSHCHDTYEILYVVSGQGRYLVEGAEVMMRPRTLMIFKPHECHSVEVKCSGPYERYVINFALSALSRETQAMLLDFVGEDSESGRYYTTDALSQTALSVFDRLEYAGNLPEREREIYMKLLLSELLVLLSGAGSHKIVRDEDELGARVAKYVNDSLEMEISLDKLSKIFFVSKYYLCRCFKRYSGVSIHSYINQKRVMFAKQLIDSGETASGAAYRVGFGDYSAFYRAYVKIFGKPPTSKTKKK